MRHERYAHVCHSSGVIECERGEDIMAIYFDFAEAS
jgi:hypothetical protein